MRRSTRYNRPGLSGSARSATLLGADGDGSTLTLDFTTGLLDPRLTFSRLSNATFINSGGLVQYADANLLLRSQEYTNAAWSKIRIDTSATGLNVANTTTAPDGSNTGLLLRADSASGSHRILQSNGTTGATYLSTAGGAITPVTLSAYFKANGSDYCALKISNNVESRGVTRTFNLTNGMVSGAEATGWSLVSAAATPVGSGWYRCEITVSLTRVDANDDVMGIWLWVANGPDVADRSFTNSAASVWVWGAQVAIGANALEYRATTTAPYQAPRFDYDPITSAPKGLLIEGQSVNRLFQSNDWNTTWNNPAPITWDGTTYTTAPDGTNTAKQITVTAGSSSAIGQAIATGTNRTISVWLKAGSLTSFSIGAFDSGGTTWGNNADSTCSIISGPGSVSQQVGGLWSITGLSTTQWTRIQIFRSSTFTTFLAYPGSSSGTINGTAFMWGMQLEDGNGASSLIPTGASTATRAAESCVMTGTNFSSWFNATEGTFLVNAIRNRTSDIGRIVSANDNTANESIDVAADTSGEFIIVDGGSTLANITPGTVTANTAFKMAGAYKLDDVQAALGGTLGTADTAVTMPTVTQLTIGRQAGASPVYLNGTLSLLKYWPSRLPDGTLQSLTL